MTNGPRVILKVVVQRRNFRQLSAFFRLALAEGVGGVAVAAPDVYSEAFHQHKPTSLERKRVLLRPEEVEEYEKLVEDLYIEYKREIEAGFIVEGNPRKLTEYFRYYLAPNDCAPRA